MRTHSIAQALYILYCNCKPRIGLLTVQHGTENLGERCSQKIGLPPIVRTHSISALQDGIIAFTDQDRRQLKLLQSEGAVKVIAGTEEENNKNGSGSHFAFGQPMGVCTEGASVFVTDGQIGTIKLVINLEGTVEFLDNGSESCTVHSRCITSTNNTRIVHSRKHTRWSRQFPLTVMEPLKT